MVVLLLIYAMNLTELWKAYKEQNTSLFLVSLAWVIVGSMLFGWMAIEAFNKRQRKKRKARAVSP